MSGPEKPINKLEDFVAMCCFSGLIDSIYKDNLLESLYKFEVFVIETGASVDSISVYSDDSSNESELNWQIRVPFDVLEQVEAAIKFLKGAAVKAGVELEYLKDKTNGENEFYSCIVRIKASKMAEDKVLAQSDGRKEKNKFSMASILSWHIYYHNEELFTKKGDEVQRHVHDFVLNVLRAIDGQDEWIQFSSGEEFSDIMKLTLKSAYDKYIARSKISHEEHGTPLRNPDQGKGLVFVFLVKFVEELSHSLHDTIKYSPGGVDLELDYIGERTKVLELTQKICDIIGDFDVEKSMDYDFQKIVDKIFDELMVMSDNSNIELLMSEIGEKAKEALGDNDRIAFNTKFYIELIGRIVEQLIRFKRDYAFDLKV